MSTVTRRDVARDVAGLLAIAASLVAIYLLVPPAVQRSLAFDHGDPRPHALLTAAYVHASLLHLASNLVAYVVAAGFTGGTRRMPRSLRSGRKQTLDDPNHVRWQGRLPTLHISFY